MNVSAERPRQVWTVEVKTPQTQGARAVVVDSGRTKLPDSPNTSPGYGARTSAAASRLGLNDFERKFADVEETGRLLERVLPVLQAEGTPDRATQDLLMRTAVEAGRRVAPRDVEEREVRVERERSSASPLSPVERAWLLSVRPFQDTLCDIIQRLCVAKAHLEVDPLLSRKLAMSVTNSVNIRASFGRVDQFRLDLAMIGQKIDLVDGIRAQRQLRAANEG